MYLFSWPVYGYLKIQFPCNLQGNLSLSGVAVMHSVFSVQVLNFSSVCQHAGFSGSLLVIDCRSGVC